MRGIMDITHRKEDVMTMESNEITDYKTPLLASRLAVLERAFALLNKRYFEGSLPQSVITISPTPGAYGHFTPWRSWEGSDGKWCEINLGAETLDREFSHTIATLIHEMVHQYCYEHGIKDTSRGNTYHNKRFRQEAEKRGLNIAYDSRIGWSVTSPSDELIALVESGVFQEIKKELHRIDSRSGRRAVGKKTASSTRKYKCPSCSQSIRATKEVNIICGDCNVTMTPVL